MTVTIEYVDDPPEGREEQWKQIVIEAHLGMGYTPEEFKEHTGYDMPKGHFEPTNEKGNVWVTHCGYNDYCYQPKGHEGGHYVPDDDVQDPFDVYGGRKVLYGVLGYYTGVGEDVQGYLIDESDNILDQHLSSNEDWLRRDLASDAAREYPEYEYRYVGVAYTGRLDI